MDGCDVARHRARRYRAGSDDDFVLLLNNDTTFGPEMVEVLVRESIEHGAAVAPIAVDAIDGSIVNAGTTIDWRRFRMLHRRDVPRESSTWPTDVFDGSRHLGAAADDPGRRQRRP